MGAIKSALTLAPGEAKILKIIFFQTIERIARFCLQKMLVPNSPSPPPSVAVNYSASSASPLKFKTLS